MRHIDTEIVKVDAANEHHASSAPIYLSATFHHTSLNDQHDYIYSPKGNPTRTDLERHLAKIMGNASFVFAVHTGGNAFEVLSRLLMPGDEVIADKSVFVASSRWLGYLEAQQGVHTHYVDTTDVSEVTTKLNERTRFVMVESPTNPLYRICDIQAISRAVKASEFGNNVIIVADNTMTSPMNANPFDLGVDIWYESGTKFLSGHHDITAGVLAVNDREIAKKLAFVVSEAGAGLDAFNSWMLLRGLKTLSVRFERQQQNAIQVGNFLMEVGPTLKVPKFELLWGGNPDMVGYDVHKRNTRGPGAILVFRTHDMDISQKIVDGVQLYSIGMSFGAVDSLISMPLLSAQKMGGAGSSANRESLPADIVRLSIGIENAGDLVDDLRKAFEKAGAL